MIEIMDVRSELLDTIVVEISGFVKFEVGGVMKPE